MKLSIPPIVLLGIISIGFITMSINDIRRGKTLVGFYGMNGKIDRDQDPNIFWIFVSSYFLIGVALLIVGIWKTLRGDIFYLG